MIEKIKNINPREITDLAEMQNLLVLFMNIIENQAKIIDELRQENQTFRDEINRLKGERGDLPPKPPKTSGSAKWEKEEKKKKKNHKKGSKKAKLPIDRTVKCEIDKSILPPDARFQGYHTVVQQELIIKRDNVLFQIPVYYSAVEKKTYRGQLPPEYEGQFGGQLKSWLQLLHHYCDVTQGRLKHLMDNIGLSISKGSISNILLSNVDEMAKESLDILRAGIEHIPYTQTDGTKGWEAGQGKSTQIICTPYYSVYHTMDSKAKASIIWALQGKTGDSVPLIYNKLAVGFLADSKVPKKDQSLLSELLNLDKTYSLEDFESILSQKAAHLMDKAGYPKMVECLSLAYYLGQSDFPKVQILMSDAGPEYNGIAAHHAFCWLHEERHYKITKKYQMPSLADLMINTL